MAKKPGKTTAANSGKTAGAGQEGRDRSGRFTPGNSYAFKPGESGNPSGRPQRTKVSEALIAQLAETAPGAGDATVAEQIAKALIKRALKGDVLAAREIADRSEGRPRQALEVDMAMLDWRQLAEAHGLNLNDVVIEAKRIIDSLESFDADRDTGDDPAQG